MKWLLVMLGYWAMPPGEWYWEIVTALLFIAAGFCSCHCDASTGETTA